MRDNGTRSSSTGAVSRRKRLAPGGIPSPPGGAASVKYKSLTDTPRRRCGRVGEPGLSHPDGRLKGIQATQKCTQTFTSVVIGNRKPVFAHSWHGLRGHTEVLVYGTLDGVYRLVASRTLNRPVSLSLDTAAVWFGRQPRT